MSSELIDRLASIELVLARNGFVASEEHEAITLPGARLCDEGYAEGLQLRTCIYPSKQDAERARLTVQDTNEANTSVVVTNRDAVLWIFDDSSADPEGRHIQKLIESFAAIQ